MAWKLYYDKLLAAALENPVTYTIDNVPERYKKKVETQAKADLKAGKLPQWQYNKMFNIGEEV